MDDDVTLPPGGAPPGADARTRDRLAELRLLVPRPAPPPAPAGPPEAEPAGAGTILP
ncbi:hypothetical protein SAMN05216207_102664 [Pseudonocardia ammonioxydans]|uniref:Uncharacterized protein n=1 Tax=Pseudonocardia ammonioxydans TaxID=260086 RepID=A0A1I5DIM7_PSUAM|nr:hypothetical protein [Pseudonocardia ammonioxydans]SFN99020.1 hypothetical protein SAMN05216207_102664 [Pseudonocardia ammonioxydans]